MRRFLLVIAVLAMAAPANEDALAAGESWLSLVDTQKYEQSWKQAAAVFQHDVVAENWTASLKKFRDPLGEMTSRKASRVDATTTLRGAPDGNYVVVHYTTNFKNKTGVTERLTVIQENGKWLVFSYAIH